jgi:hypothetical protein
MVGPYIRGNILMQIQAPITHWPKSGTMACVIPLGDMSLSSLERARDKLRGRWNGLKDEITCHNHPTSRLSIIIGNSDVPAERLQKKKQLVKDLSDILDIPERDIDLRLNDKG